MTTYNQIVGTYPAERVVERQERVHVVTKVFDAKKTPMLSGDIVQLLGLAERQKVLEVHMNVTRAEGAAVTFDIGDSGLVTRYLTAQDGNALGQATSTLGAVAVYGTDDYIQIRLNANASNAQIVIKALVIDYANDLPAYDPDLDKN